MFDGTDKFLGDRRLSYNLLLTFTLYLDDDHDDVRASVHDVVLEGDGRTVSAPIFAQGNPTPSRTTHKYRYRLNEHRSQQWTPQLSTDQFMRLLANLTAIRIRAQFSARGIEEINCLVLESATHMKCNEFAQNAVVHNYRQVLS